MDGIPAFEGTQGGIIRGTMMLPVEAVGPRPEIHVKTSAARTRRSKGADGRDANKGQGGRATGGRVI